MTTANSSAEFMQATDVTTTSKSGANRLHGTGFWFNQDSALTATTRFTPRDANGEAIKPDISASSFGASAGGPLARNRAFFFATYEGVRRPNEVTLTQLVPPDTWRSGDMSSVSTPIPIRSPDSRSPAIEFPSTPSRRRFSTRSTPGRINQPAPRSTRRTSS